MDLSFVTNMAISIDLLRYFINMTLLYHSIMVVDVCNRFLFWA